MQENWWRIWNYWTSSNATDEVFCAKHSWQITILGFQSICSTPEPGTCLLTFIKKKSLLKKSFLIIKDFLLAMQNLYKVIIWIVSVVL